MHRWRCKVTIKEGYGSKAKEFLSHQLWTHDETIDKGHPVDITGYPNCKHNNWSGEIITTDQPQYKRTCKLCGKKQLWFSDDPLKEVPGRWINIK